GGRDEARLPRARDQQYDRAHLGALEHLRQQQIPAHVPEPHCVVRVERDATACVRHVPYYSVDAGTVRVCSFVQNDSRAPCGVAEGSVTPLTDGSLALRPEKKA